MANPTAGDVHVNKPLTNVSIAFIQNASNFIATDVFPNIPTTAKSDVFFTYDRGEFNRNEMVERAPGTESAGGGYDITTDNFSARVYAFHKDIDDQIRANSDSPINLEREATIYVTTKALIKREKLWVTNFFNTSIWTTDITGVASSPTGDQVLQWNDAASTPIEDIEAGKTVILQSTGFDANVLVLGYEVWTQLKNHPDIIDRIKFSGGVSPDRPAVVSLGALSQLIGIDKIVIMKSIENTAKEGQTPTHVFIGGKKAFLCHAAPNPGIYTPTAGYTFSWTGFLNAGNQGNRIKKFRMEQLESDRVEISMAFDQKVISADMGYFFTLIVA